jgi:enoyl-[acyl-carrier-protein] reductase (NADH)
MKRLEERTEVKRTAVYLASEASKLVTGHDLVTDGRDLLCTKKYALLMSLNWLTSGLRDF